MRGKLVFSYGGNPGVGSLHRFRDAVENGWPRPLRIVEHSHAGLANAYVAGAVAACRSRVLRGYLGTGLAELNDDVAHGHVPVHRRGALPPCGRCAPTSRSSTPSRPTATAT